MKETMLIVEDTGPPPTRLYSKMKKADIRKTLN
jgi:hypothetical protein